MLTAEGAALRERNFAVIGIGDMNARLGQVPGLKANHPGLNENTHLFRSFLRSLNLLVLNTLPISRGLFTHFMEREGVPPSESIL